ncbi:hypothetical protein BG011_004888 [Mortierella polycephala]|uniref:Uncharacterized protein n=1 Tax=Mortierella polycephala TaxID=41804 RepID=A0A9P6PX29_9FUNG|nr:hypothetical protein BG011_004888 [Mortierella polycephala]
MTQSSGSSSRLRNFLRYDTLDLSRFVASNLISAKALLVVRLIISIHLVAVFITTLYVSARDKVFYMVPTTFTNLSNIGLTAYYLAATYHSFGFVRHKDLRSLTTQHWFLTSALSLLYASTVVFHIVVPIIYWALLFNPNHGMDTVNEYVDYSHHGADLGCILFEMVLNRMEMPGVSVLGPLSRDALLKKRRQVVGTRDGSIAFEKNQCRSEDEENPNQSQEGVQQENEAFSEDQKIEDIPKCKT